MQIINYIVSLGTSVMMPIIFFILALLMGVKIGKAFKAALLVGVGFEGLSLVINLLLDNLGPAAKAMISNLGVKLNVLDAGWSVAATVGWGSKIMVVCVITFILINVVMIVLKLTNTVDIDIFNYWIFLCEGALIYVVTNNMVITVVMTGLLFALMLKVGDWTAETIESQFDLKGISFPHLTASGHILFAVIVNFIFDRIPALKKIKLNPENLTEKFGILGEPIAIGFILGAIIGALAGYDGGAIATLAIKVSASMILLPRMVDVLLEGLDIIKESVEIKLKKIFPDREFYIGMDVALLVGDPSIIAVGVLMIPITLLLAIIIPGNKVLPFVDLPSLIFLFPMVAPFCKKNMARMFVTGLLMMTFILFAASDLASIYSQAALQAHATFPSGMDIMSALNVGFTNPIGWIVVKISQVIAHIL